MQYVIHANFLQTPANHGPVEAAYQWTVHPWTGALGRTWDGQCAFEIIKRCPGYSVRLKNVRHKMHECNTDKPPIVVLLSYSKLMAHLCTV